MNPTSSVRKRRRRLGKKTKSRDLALSMGPSRSAYSWLGAKGIKSMIQSVILMPLEC